jgi:hypothetical protein
VCWLMKLKRTSQDTEFASAFAFIYQRRYNAFLVAFFVLHL